MQNNIILLIDAGKAKLKIMYEKKLSKLGINTCGILQFYTMPSGKPSANLMFNNNKLNPFLGSKQRYLLSQCLLNIVLEVLARVRLEGKKTSKGRGIKAKYWK